MGLRNWIVLLTALCLMAGCKKAGSEEQFPNKNIESVEAKSPLSDTQGDFQVVEPGSVYTGPIEIPLPEASGQVVYEENGITVDASNTEDGYLMVKGFASDTRLKVQITLNEETYTYDLNQEQEYEVYPLQMGNGTYGVQVFQQVEGTSYSPVYYTEVEVEMPDTDRVFLYPSQYVWYTNDKNAVKLSYDLCAELDSDKEKAERLYDYIVNLLTYDYEKAATVEKGYLPDVDATLQERKGICFDYSALFAAMLRAQDIPVRLAIGYVQPDNIYHAWNQVYLDGEWVWMDSTFGPESAYTEENYTKERQY
ncbi:MAG: transglutaminase domain-containing protein [Lachnospiraceae bacterium]|jgi:hypothetical protein|uniref:transglutaminase-like domain-containing protein n=1 Tax=Candidatus Merdisoma sp. JLR.KK011 TaxID=3114299 RepID=UPI0014350BE9|nr:transglutaminase domain-containing protein [Lachnospiraceae bacterium]MCI9251370.1 transglutaminase domain-containing protein [Lachnospiraceae bacterium]MCI9477820.1 transglutaminase domain-containing protein [Lachnospiraceae bacterium]MCI9622234.1 transglutaminase domain-containing protein [Lachnospiraceae bacterium]GFI11097.1 hypothetical protein IMSAGC007_03570 [Lachnospiraceae bacterium]